MLHTYEETLNFLYSNLPMFQRVGAAAYKADLTNTIALLKDLGNPEQKFKSIHIAGTNGKGSTSHMLASVFQSAGYKTGLYTSPHLKSFTERIRINGEEVTKDFVVDFVNRIEHSIKTIKPSFFEITVAMAFEYFAQQRVDIAVIEVGLGGRLDSTNVITPLLSVITNISFDHKDILGDTLEKIAYEKAGVIKKGVPLVISQKQHEVESVFIDKAEETNSSLYFASDLIQVQSKVIKGKRSFTVTYPEGKLEDVQLPLQGIYQEKNLSGVIEALLLLRERFNLTDQHIKHGLENVVQQTHLKGRWQVLQQTPLVVCDTGHNVDGVKQVLKQIEQQQYNDLHLVWGMVKDKDVTEVLSLLPRKAHYYFCQANIPRAMDAYELAQKANGFNLKGKVIKDVNEAIAEARKNASDHDLIFIGGSTFVVAEIQDL